MASHGRRWANERAGRQRPGPRAGQTTEQTEAESGTIYDICFGSLETAKYDAAQTGITAEAPRGLRFLNGFGASLIYTCESPRYYNVTAGTDVIQAQCASSLGVLP